MALPAQWGRRQAPDRQNTGFMTADYRSALLDCAAADDGDVACGALYLAAEDCDGVDVEGSLQILDELAADLRSRVESVRGHSVIPVLAGVLREKLQLRGAGGGDPQAHYLHRVLARGAGVPIACAIIWIAVSRRATAEAEGVGLPGHFVVRVNGALVDAYAGGEVLDDSAARRIVGNALGDEPDHLDPVWLMATSTRSILARMSRNLRGCYVARENWELALRAADRCVDLLPDVPLERRDRGLLRWRMGQTSGAAADLRSYLEAVPQATDKSSVEDVLSRLRSSLN